MAGHGTGPPLEIREVLLPCEASEGQARRPRRDEMGAETCLPQRELPCAVSAPRTGFPSCPGQAMCSVSPGSGGPWSHPGGSLVLTSHVRRGRRLSQLHQSPHLGHRTGRSEEAKKGVMGVPFSEDKAWRSGRSGAPMCRAMPGLCPGLDSHCTIICMAD